MPLLQVITAWQQAPAPSPADAPQANVSAVIAFALCKSPLLDLSFYLLLYCLFVYFLSIYSIVL